MKTTLNLIRACSPCASGWSKLLAHLGKTGPDDEPLSLVTILDSNGLGDALWALRTVEGFDREKRLFAVWCARQVEHLLTDQRSRDALDVAERYARGRATREELDAAADAADAAAYAAARVPARVARVARVAQSAARAGELRAVARAGELRAVARAGELRAVARAGELRAVEFRRVCACIDAGRDPYPESEV